MRSLGAFHTENAGLCEMSVQSLETTQVSNSKTLSLGSSPCGHDNGAFPQRLDEGTSGLHWRLLTASNGALSS